MVQEFEGRTEQDAIDAAVEALGLEAHEFEVEIVSTRSGGLFGRNKAVRIAVHYAGTEDSRETEKKSDAPRQRAAGSTRATGEALHPETDFEHAVVDFVTTVTEKMGFPSKVSISFREPQKLGIRLESEHTNILIGRKGKNLDALQLLANVLSGRFVDSEIKVILDTEGYRGRREEQLIQLAHKVGDQVKRTRGSKLLEPMNPFERRLIHTTLNDIADIGTESEGEGLYKQVRIFYRGSK
ncbi:single-stranded DNA-binding protein [Alkalispirochaeta sphaeroplastigenens]|uniref:RNA-binding protein KhpB n=1 Tax=Alkalispirochaeta sphaeroplastigenens TaxID=1187066 RepID=A0A2S4K0R1_9SPIO|nr:MULTISPECIES: RNA-binding cell elongation regulator Jag/EloR [Alkalispirochaeta]POR05362.1 single-stranded DNA-binding protein [Alkalispirochaeta sphaeroplastigenens]